MKLEVHLWDRRVGTLSDEAEVGGIPFQYAGEWLDGGFNLSPFALEWDTRVQWREGDRTFEGLHGIFADSLPDAWGRALMDEQFRRQGRNPELVTLLERLAYVGDRAWGGLTYRPDLASADRDVLTALDLIASERSARAVLKGNMSEVLPAVIESGASTGGARPKQRIAISASHPDEIWYGKGLPPEGFDSWILKIETDPKRQYGRVECAYYQLAAVAGLDVPLTRLIEAPSSSVQRTGHFAIQRFDWVGSERFHCHTLAGLLGKNWNLGDCDYDEFLRAALALTSDKRAIEEVFRRMVFNVHFGLRDDHAKNHAFLRKPLEGWSLPPAYDVMFSRPGAGNGLHRQMPVMGRRQGISVVDIREMGRRHGLKPSVVTSTFDQIAVAASAWENIASELGIDEIRMREIRNAWEPVVDAH